MAGFAPAAFFVVPAARGQTPSSLAALGICVMAGFYALIRWLTQGPLLRYSARRSHTEDLSGDPDDVAPDGRILATGKYERWLRILAVPAAVLSCAWPIAFLKKLPALVSQGAFAILFQLVLLALGVTVVVQFAGRARGKMVWSKRGDRNPAGLWTSSLMINLVLSSWLDWSKGTFHRVLYVVAGILVLIGLAGWRLEKKRKISSQGS